MMKFHKIILAIELIIFALPITGLFIYFGFFNFIGSVFGRPFGIGYPIVEILSTTLIFIILYTLWKLAYTFYCKDRLVFINSSGTRWSILIIGIIYSVIGVFAYISWTSPVSPLNELLVFNLSIMFFKYGIFGAPVIIPALHLIFIRSYTMKNYSEISVGVLNDS